MQTLLTTPSFALHAAWKRIIAGASYGLLASLTLLVLLSFGNRAQAADFVQNSVTLNSGGGRDVNTPTAKGTYFTNVPNSPGPKFTDNISNLGTFDRGTGFLTLGATSVTMEASNESVVSSQLFYRVYQVATPIATRPDFSPLVLLQQNATGSGLNKTWQSISVADILNATPGQGSYVLEFYFQLSDIVNGDNANPITKNDDNNGNFYSATFTVNGSVPATWNGAINNEWSNGDNWSTGRPPGFTTDVTIPYVDTPDFPYPVVVDGQRVQARTLTLASDPSGSGLGATVTIAGGELQIFGDFQDPSGSFTQTAGLFTLAGSNQTFDGGTFTDFKIQGQGTKTLNTIMTVTSSLVFNSSFGNNTLITRTENANSFRVDLDANAVVMGETENSFVLGYLRATSRTMTRGVRNDFSNIGVSLTTTSGGSFGITTTRYTGYAYRGATDGSRSNSVKRSFTFLPAGAATSFNYVIAFHYLNTELNGNTGANLNVYSSPSRTSSFVSIGKTGYDAAAQTVTAQSTGTLATTFILAEPAAPLPVTLIRFTATATAQGAALLRWATATETNNRGFGIERQLGANQAWQSVGFVAASNTTGSTYEFTDKSLISAPASTQAYYRLRQEDLDAKVTYSPVAVVNRTAAVAGVATEMTLSPVPVGGTDNLSVGLAEAGQAGIVVTVTNTQGQRMMNITTQASTDAALSLPVAQLAAGVYIVTVQVPGQAVRHARFVKL